MIQGNQQQRRNRQSIQEEQQNEERQYDTFLYKFQQQIIDAWKPVPYTQNNVILYSILTVICVTLGLVLILTAPSSPQIQSRYDANCAVDQVCSHEIILESKLEPPSYLYYGFTNYYQNHRRYLKFFSIDQMKGNQIDELTAKAQCGDSLYTNKQINAGLALDQTTDLSSQGYADKIAYPCGARAKSFLQLKPQIDSFELKFSNGSSVPLQKNNIAWPSDPEVYQNSIDEQTRKLQAINITDQDWLVWFRPAARSRFFKLHSRIEQQLPAGKYTFSWKNAFPKIEGNQKMIHLSRSNYVGNKDLFLGIAFLSLGGGCLIVLIIFIAKCVTQRRERPKND